MPLSRQQALDLLASDDLIGLGMEADAVRRRIAPEPVVTYLQCGNISFDRQASPHTQIAALTDRICLLAEQGASSISCTSSAGLPLDAIAAHLSVWRNEFPHLSFAALTPAELIALSSDHAVDAIFSRLRDAGLCSLCATPTPLDADALALHRAAHRAGIPTTATVLLEVDPSEASTPGDSIITTHLLDSLEALRRLQDETGGFTALLITYRPAATIAEEPTAIATLKALAVARMLVDNIPHITVEPASLGPKLLQMALSFGADDAGALTLTAEGPRYSLSRTLRAAPAPLPPGLTEEELRRIIRDAGFQPAERDTLYRMCFLG